MNDNEAQPRISVTASLDDNDYTQIKIKVREGISPLRAVELLAKVATALLLESKAGLAKHGGEPK